MKKKFNDILLENESDEKFIPYQYNKLEELDINYEQLKKLFIKRRSVRWYKDKEIPNELIIKAVNIATLAPSACNRQPYHFVISKNKQQALEIAKCAGGTPGWDENIPCIVVIVGIYI